MSNVRTPARPSAHPFALPRQLTPDLARVLDYWRGLLRGEANIPFADDLNSTDLPDLRERLFVIDAFDRPQRFRFASIGRALSADSLGGMFLDEIHLPRPFEFLGAQATATAECRAPTFYHHETEHPYLRLLLPFWSDGRISTLLGIVDRD